MVNETHSLGRRLRSMGSGLRRAVGASLDRLLPTVIHQDIEVQRRMRILIGVNLAMLLIAFTNIYTFRHFTWNNSAWLTPLAAAIAAISSTVALWVTKSHKASAMIVSLGLCLSAIPLLYPQGGLYARSVYWLALMPLFGMFLLGRGWGLICLVVSLLGVVGLHLAPMLGFALPPPKQIPPGGLFLIVVCFHFFAIAIGWMFESSRQKAQMALLDSLEEKRQLALDKEAAELANRSKSEFLAMMSHELRTPLNAIIGYAELIQEEAEDADPDELRDDSQKILTAGKHLLTLINDLLDLSKIEAGRLTIQPDELDLSSLMQELTREFTPRADARGNTFAVEQASEIQTMVTDPTRLRQCLHNLLDNACKFTTEGTITLSISAKTDPSHPSSQRILFAVKDTGSGIPPEKQGDIFGRFIQADTSYTRKHGGSGLGLAITKELVEAMGGTIQLESDVGKGTTFWLDLPKSCH